MSFNKREMDTMADWMRKVREVLPEHAPLLREDRLDNSILRFHGSPRGVLIVQFWPNGGFSHYIEGSAKWDGFKEDVQRLWEIKS